MSGFDLSLTLSLHKKKKFPCFVIQPDHELLSADQITDEENFNFSDDALFV